MANANWLNDVDPASLGEEAEALYNEYRAAYRAASAKRDAFEAHVNDAMRDAGRLPNGKAVVFSYRFGKLSMSLGDARPARKAAAKPVSLQDWLANQ